MTTELTMNTQNRFVPVPFGVVFSPCVSSVHSLLSQSACNGGFTAKNATAASDRQTLKPLHSHGAKRARSFNSAIAHALTFENAAEVSFFLELVQLHKPNANASNSAWAAMERAWNSRVVMEEAAARRHASAPTLRKTTAAMLHAFNRRMVDNHGAAAASNSAPFAAVSADRALRTEHIAGGGAAVPPLAQPRVRAPAPPLRQATLGYGPAPPQRA